MESIDWSIIIVSFCFTLAVSLTFILIKLLKRERDIKELNERVQKLFDEDF